MFVTQFSLLILLSAIQNYNLTRMLLSLYAVPPAYYAHLLALP